eukprot:g13091.t1
MSPDHPAGPREDLGNDFWQGLSTYLSSHLPPEKAGLVLEEYRGLYTRELMKLSIDDVEEAVRQLKEGEEEEQ